MKVNSSEGKSSVLALFFVFVVLFILVFGLGVFVGKEFSKKEIRVTKTFEEPSPPEPAPSVQESEESGDEIIEREFTETEPGEENANETSTEEAEEIVEEEVTTEPAPSEAPSVAEPEEPAPVAADVPVRTEAPAEKATEERLAEITEEIERKVEAERAEKQVPARITTLPPVSPDGRYTVQIGSFQSQDEANKLASSMRSKGYPVFIKSIRMPDNKNWYRVRIGTFSDLDTAKKYGDGLKAREPDVKLVFVTVND